MVTSRRTTQYLRALLNKESAVQRSEEHPSLPPESAQLIRLLARLKQPERILEIYANPATPGTPKSSRNGRSNKFPSRICIPLLIRRSVQIKKGSIEGRTVKSHKTTAFLAEAKELCGEIIIRRVPPTAIRAVIFCWDNSVPRSFHLSPPFPPLQRRPPLYLRVLIVRAMPPF